MKELFEQARKPNEIRLDEDRNKFTKSGLPLRRLLLPNVRFFKVLSKKLDELMKTFGLERALFRNFAVEKADNWAVNRYLTKIYDRLHRYAKKGDAEKYNKLIKIVSKRSKAIRAIGLFRVNPRWYKEITLTKLWKMMKKIDRILFHEIKALEYKRIWIPKPNGKLRPLAIPPMEWRVVMNIYNIYLSIWLQGQPYYQHKNLYGTTPGKGTARCWKEIMEKVVDQETIVEFDLTKFFDAVPWQRIWNMMNKHNIPEEFKKILIGITALAPQNLKKLRYKELAGIILADHWSQDYKSEAEVGTRKWRIEENKHSILNQLSEGYRTNPREQLLREIKAMEEWDATSEFLRGVPQGVATSPNLACMTLAPVLKKREGSLLMYMDDGLIFGNLSNEEINVILFELEQFTGTKINYEKSAVIKEKGKWFKNLKFLGLEYDYQTKELKAATRKGATLSFPKPVDWDKFYKLLHFYGVSGDAKIKEKKNVTELLLKSSRFDFMTAYLYGNGNLSFPKKQRKMKANSFQGAIFQAEEKTMSSLVLPLVHDWWKEASLGVNKSKHLPDLMRGSQAASNPISL